MSKRSAPSQQKSSAAAATGDLKHNPFAGLAKQRELAAKAAPALPTVAARATAPKPLPAPRIRIRLESAGRSGKVVTRISGLPQHNVEAIAARLRKALGCGASVQDTDVILQGTLDLRAQQWFDQVGDLRAVADTPAPAKPQPAVNAAPATAVAHAPLSASGTRRSDVHRGRRVGIVQKADQPSGKLTQGVVRDVLTNSAVHPRGIKVRLETGEVGRVQVIYE